MPHTRHLAFNENNKRYKETTEIMCCHGIINKCYYQRLLVSPEMVCGCRPAYMETQLYPRWLIDTAGLFSCAMCSIPQTIQ